MTLMLGAIAGVSLVGGIGDEHHAGGGTERMREIGLAKPGARQSQILLQFLLDGPLLSVA